MFDNPPVNELPILLTINDIKQAVLHCLDLPLQQGSDVDIDLNNLSWEEKDGLFANFRATKLQGKGA